MRFLDSPSFETSISKIVKNIITMIGPSKSPFKPKTDSPPKIAKKITMDIRSQAVLQDVKKALVALPRGYTQVVLNLHGAEKVATLVLPGGVELGATTVADLSALGIKVEIE